MDNIYKKSKFKISTNNLAENVQVKFISSKDEILTDN